MSITLSPKLFDLNYWKVMYMNFMFGRLNFGLSSLENRGLLLEDDFFNNR